MPSCPAGQQFDQSQNRCVYTLDSLAACGFETRAQIIWAKNNFAIGRGHYHCKHEPCAIRTRFDEIPCSSHEKIL
jgi:hypothetical protein